MHDFKPKIVHTKPNTRSIVKSLPSSLYTSNECLKIIKERDKDSEAEYVKEFMSDVAKELSK